MQKLVWYKNSHLICLYLYGEIIENPTLCWDVSPKDGINGTIWTPHYRKNLNSHILWEKNNNENNHIIEIICSTNTEQKENELLYKLYTSILNDIYCQFISYNTIDFVDFESVYFFESFLPIPKHKLKVLNKNGIEKAKEMTKYSFLKEEFYLKKYGSRSKIILIPFTEKFYKYLLKIDKTRYNKEREYYLYWGTFDYYADCIQITPDKLCGIYYINNLIK